MRNWFKLIVMMVLGCIVLTSSPALANDYKPQIGKMYFVVVYPGLPGTPQRFLSQTDLNILKYFDNVCQGDLKAQRPNGLSEVFHTTVFGALGAGLGNGAGYAIDGSPYSTAKSGLKLGGAYGAVSGLFSGIDGRQRSNRYDLGQCMIQFVNSAQQIDGKLMGVGVIINSHAVNGKGIKRLQISANDNAPAASNDNAAPTRAATPAVIP